MDRMWFNFILGLNFASLCFELVIICYHTSKQNFTKVKIELQQIIWNPGCPVLKFFSKLILHHGLVPGYKVVFNRDDCIKRVDPFSVVAVPATTLHQLVAIIMATDSLWPEQNSNSSKSSSLTIAEAWGNSGHWFPHKMNLFWRTSAEIP